MSNVRTIVLYPAVGFMGAIAVQRTNEAVEAVKAKGRTDRARFDLARSFDIRPNVYGVYHFDERRVPQEWRVPASKLQSLEA